MKRLIWCGTVAAVLAFAGCAVRCTYCHPPVHHHHHEIQVMPPHSEGPRIEPIPMQPPPKPVPQGPQIETGSRIDGPRGDGWRPATRKSVPVILLPPVDVEESAPAKEAPKPSAPRDEYEGPTAVA